MRKLGVLLHITSLYGRDLIGTLGKASHEMLHKLKSANISVWQVLPICPSGYGNSPYSSPSLFAFNPLLIDIDALREEDLIDEKDCDKYFSLVANIRAKDNFNDCVVYYDFLRCKKIDTLKKAAIYTLKRFQLDKELKKEYDKFCERESFWLDDYAYFLALKENDGLNIQNIIKKFREKKEHDIKKCEIEKVLQFFFYRQWSIFKKSANKMGILLFGDLPIFPSYQSADVASNSKLFYLDKNDEPAFVAGVPPDYFSDTGQLWGNPLYNWDAMKEDGYRWWMERIKQSMELFDLLRLDHFRAFHSFWAIDGKASSAKDGQWILAKGSEFFSLLKKELGILPIIAEDLGIITDEVRNLKNDFGFMGMKILQFAFNASEYKNERVSCPYLPHNIEENSVAYTGTHDNDTTFGWIEKMPCDEKDFLLKYLNLNPVTSTEKITKALVRLAISSRASLAIIPIQDFCTLNSASRMNVPGTKDENWKWRMKEDALSESILQEIREISIVYGRNT